VRDQRMSYSGVLPPTTDRTEVLEEPLGPMRANTSPGLQLPLMPYIICGSSAGGVKESLRCLTFSNEAIYVPVLP